MLTRLVFVVNKTYIHHFFCAKAAKSDTHVYSR